MKLRNWIAGLVAVTLAAPALWWLLLENYPPRQTDVMFYLGLWHGVTDGGAYPIGGYIMVLVTVWFVYLLCFLAAVSNDRAKRQLAEERAAKAAAGAVAHQSLMP
jgi:hypothetical protein